MDLELRRSGHACGLPSRCPSSRVGIQIVKACASASQQLQQSQPLGTLDGVGAVAGTKLAVGAARVLLYGVSAA